MLLLSAYTAYIFSKNQKSAYISSILSRLFTSVSLVLSFIFDGVAPYVNPNDVSI